MLDQNVLELETQNTNSRNLESVLTLSNVKSVVKAEKSSSTIDKKQKIYSENDSKKFESILIRFKEKMNEKNMTRNQLLTQHKNTLLELFELGATVEEVLLFLEENNFSGLTAENLREFSKKLK
ncbi:hypothetical protein M5F00_11040 [Acinetobacter sp. ANC 4945]|uniref:Uncharacterized protein n=1 Tax=Acinetobacter amyesii TaxID=2942470 RepID=A0A1T1GQ47_9GAMM|nr:hypothetical protein [Acinetobacter amyesii]MCL6248396.1 hypothetical protein [Acinetobacter amyesii]OOV79660.1 hypothetical protein B1202_16035 [Acinetobacter amyesii]